MGQSFDVENLRKFSGLAYVGNAFSKELRGSLLKEDILKLSSILVQLNSQNDVWSSWDQRRFKASLESENVGLYLLKEDVQELRGFVLFSQTIPGEFEILHLSVQPRGMGLGKILMGQFLLCAKNVLGASKLTLEVSELNMAAIKLYGGFAFQQIAHRPNYYKDKSAALVFTLVL